MIVRAIFDMYQNLRGAMSFMKIGVGLLYFPKLFIYINIDNLWHIFEF